MNGTTVDLIQRPYQEIVDDLLVALVGGVVREPIVFDLLTDRYALKQPATSVRTISGTVSVPDPKTGLLTPQPHTFLPVVDYVFDTTANAIIWQKATRPDDQSTFYVDYLLPVPSSPLSDVNVGSVLRTLGEAIGREIAVVYQEINQAWLGAFVETAKGQALDLVVSILGIQRETKEYASGLVTFFRDTSAGDGDIAIVVGTVLRTANGLATFATTELRTLQRGQPRIDVPVRATGASRGPAGIVPSGAISVQASPLLGIASVSNIDPTTLGAADETDDQLRARAEAALRSVGDATVAALYRVVAEERSQILEIWDPDGGPGKTSPPGQVALLLQTEPARFPSVRDVIQQTRAAGVQAVVVAQYVYFTPRLTIQLTGTPTPDGQLKIINQVIAALQGYVNGLKVGQNASGGAMLSAIKAVPGVTNPVFADVAASVSDTVRPTAQAIVDAVIAALPSTSVTPDVVKTVLQNALAAAAQGPPTATRIPARDQVIGPSGQPATDADIAAGTFSVSATVKGDNQWWVVLDMQPSDVVVKAGTS